MNHNLDYHAQLAAQNIVRDGGKLEDCARRTLAVLQEQGVYAALLYLYAKEKNKGAANSVSKELLDLVINHGIAPLKAEEKHEQQKLNRGDEIGNRLFWLKHVSSEITSNITVLLLVKQLWEQTLIYALFASKIGK